MRTLLLVLLGSCLCWLVWKSSGASRASAETTKGYLRPAATNGSDGGAGVADAPDAAESGSGDAETPGGLGTLVPVREAAPSSDAQIVKAEPTANAPGSAADVSAPRDAPTASARPVGDEIALASALVHRPQSLIDGAVGATQDTTRRNLAVCWAHAALGHDDEARSIGAKLLAGDDLSSAERALVERSIQPRASRPAQASLTRESPLVLAASMALMAREGREALAAGHARDASRVFSRLLLEEIVAPWTAERDTLLRWTEDLRRAQAGYQWNRAGEWPSFELKVEKGDSLISIRKRALAERAEILLCTGQIELANELRGAVLQPGQTLRIPTEKASVIVDLDAHWAFYLMGDEVAAAWEVGVGRAGNETRVGEYRAGEKREEPMWFPAGRAPVPYGDAENPLGTRWIGLTHPDGTTTGLGLHGTNEPSSIGKDASQGCVRLRNEEIEALFEILPKGAVVSIRP